MMRSNWRLEVGIGLVLLVVVAMLAMEGVLWAQSPVPPPPPPVRPTKTPGWYVPPLPGPGTPGVVVTKPARVFRVALPVVMR